MTASTKEPTRGQAVPGEDAEKPQEIPAKGWFQIAKRGWKEAKADQVPLLAAGVAFYGFLAIFPAIIAGVLLYGLIADPATISAQLDSLGNAVPAAAKDLINQQLQTVASKPQSTVVSFIFTILLALWSASGGVSNLMTAINTAYDEEETRGFIKKRGLALLLTVGAILFMVVLLALVAVAPAVLSILGTSGIVNVLLQVGRYVVLVLVIAVALAVLYRVAPDRDAPKMRWVSVGAGVATVIWLLASIGFSIYAGRGGYENSYGAIAGVVVLLFWLWITAYAILLGAEINAESEQQTVADTTKGEPEPLGDRNAVAADSTPGDAEQKTAEKPKH